MVNLSIVCELDTRSQDLNAEIAPQDCLFGNVKIIKNANPDKYSYTRYGIRFDSRSIFSIPNFD